MKKLILILFLFSTCLTYGETRPDYAQIKNSPVISTREYRLRGDGVTDDTSAFNAMVAAIPEFSHVKFEAGKTYLGNFISTKSLVLDFQNSTVVPATNSEAVGFKGSATLIGNITGTTTFGDKTITLAGHGLTKGDLFYIVDRRTRPSDGTAGINTELLCVATNTADVITVEDMIRSEQSSGTVALYKITPIVSPRVLNCKILFSATSTNPGIYFQKCLSPLAERCETTNNYGDAVRFDYCHSVQTRNIITKHPRVLAGYGVLANKCRNVTIENTEGWSVDTIVDIASCYNVTVVGVRGSADVGVTMAHNAFGGNIRVRDVDVFFHQYAVVWSRQGLTTAEYNTFSISDVDVKSVKSSTNKSVDNSIAAVSIQCTPNRFDIDGVDMRAFNTTTGTASASSVVFVYGATGDAGRISNVSSNFAWATVRILGPTTTDLTTPVPIRISNVSAGVCDYIVFSQGASAISFDGLRATSVNKAVTSVGKNGAMVPTDISWVDGASGMPFYSVPLMSYDSTQLPVRGSPPVSTSRIGSYITLETGVKTTITDLDLYGRYGGFGLSGSGTVTLATDTPIVAPLWLGQRMFVHVTGSAITIASGTNTVYTSDGNITLSPRSQYLFQSIGGAKWLVTPVGSFTF